MTATILDGKALAEEIRNETAKRVSQFVSSKGVIPCLAAVLVGENPASQVYVRNKRTACEKAGIESQLHRLSAQTTTEELLDLVDKLNKGIAAVKADGTLDKLTQKWIVGSGQ